MCLAAVSVIFKLRADKPSLNLVRKNKMVLWLSLAVIAVFVPASNKALPVRKMRKTPKASSAISVGSIKGVSSGPLQAEQNDRECHKLAKGQEIGPQCIQYKCRLSHLILVEHYAVNDVVEAQRTPLGVILTQKCNTVLVHAFLPLLKSFAFPLCMLALLVHRKIKRALSVTPCPSVSKLQSDVLLILSVILFTEKFFEGKCLCS